MSLVWDCDQIKEFVEKALPKLEKDEVFIMMLCARKKYCSELKRSEEGLCQKVIRTNDPKIVTQKIEQITSSPYFQDGEKIPQKAMAVYIDPNPKSTIKAFSTFVKETMNQVYSLTQNQDESVYNYFRKLDVRLFSAIHRSTSRRWCWIIDVDKKDQSLLHEILTKLGENTIWVTETRGGYHVLVRATKTAGKIIFTEIVKVQDVEIQKEAMTPIPGTIQGGFKVRKVIF